MFPTLPKLYRGLGRAWKSFARSYFELFSLLDKSPKKATNFDELRVTVYNTYSKAFNLENMPCSSTALKEHIKRAYIQANLWMTATLPHRPIIEYVGHSMDGN